MFISLFPKRLYELFDFKFAGFVFPPHLFFIFFFKDLKIPLGELYASAMKSEYFSRS